MSDNTVDYSDSRIDPGGDKQYDSSAYGSTTGDLKSDKYDQGVFGAGDGKEEGNKQQQQQQHPREKQVEANINTQSNSSGHVAGESKTQDERKAKQVQGYSATGDMNPEVGA